MGIFKYIRAIIICGPRILWSYFAWMIKYSKNPTKYPLDKRYQKLRKLIIFVYKGLRVDIMTKNASLLDSKDKYLLIANHFSAADPLSLIAISEKPITFIAKKEVKRMPFIGKCVKILEGIFLDRDDLKKQVEEIKRASDLVKNGYINVCIFPEGTRNKHPFTPTAPFKPGSLKIATLAEAPIITCAQFGTHRIFSTKMYLKKIPVSFDFLRRVNYDEYKDFSTVKLADDFHLEISKEVKNLIEEDEKYIKKLKRK